MLQQLLFRLICMIGGRVVVIVMKLCIDWFVAFDITFLGIREVPQFVSLVLFRQVFGAECGGAVVVVRRHGADETLFDPYGRGGGRGVPHVVHLGRLQGLVQVLFFLLLVQLCWVSIVLLMVCSF